MVDRHGKPSANSGNFVFDAIRDAVTSLLRINNIAIVLAIAYLVGQTLTWATPEIAAAVARGVNARTITLARQQVTMGDQEVLRRAVREAITSYEDAWLVGRLARRTLGLTTSP